MIRCRLAAPMLLLALVAAGGARAQDTGSKHDSNAPIDWDANQIQVFDRDHKAILTGAVRAKQEEMTLTSDRATAFYTGSIANSGGSGGGGGGPQINRLQANGHVVVTRPTEVAHGDYGIYDLDKKLITMTGHVVLDRTGANAGTTRGNRLVIDLNTNQARMDGGAVGGSGTPTSGGRVSGRFTVAKQNDQSPPAATKPAGK